MSQILDYYETILPAFALQADDAGLISSVKPTGSKSPATIDGKRLALPTKEFLRKGFGEDYIGFHPLSESLSRLGTSPVQQYLQRAAKANIAYLFVQLTTALLEASVDKETQKDIPPTATGFLKVLANADKKTLDAFLKLIAIAIKKNRLVSVYLKANGVYKNKKVNRMTVIRFLVYGDLLDEKKMGVPLTKKQRETILSLFEHVIPFGDSVDEYSYGTNDRVAPYFTSFLTAYHKTVSHLNDLINRYAKPLCLNLKPVDLYELEPAKTLSKLASEVPTLEGNAGEVEETLEDIVQESSVTEVKPTTAKATVTPKAATAVASNTVSMNDFMQAMNPQPLMQQQQTFQQPVNTGFQNNFTGFQPQQPVNNGFSGFNNNVNTGNSFAPANVALPWQQNNTGFSNSNVNPGNPFSAAVAPQIGGFNNNNGLGLV